MRSRRGRSGADAQRDGAHGTADHVLVPWDVGRALVCAARGAAVVGGEHGDHPFDRFMMRNSVGSARAGEQKPKVGNPSTLGGMKPETQVAASLGGHLYETLGSWV